MDYAQTLMNALHCMELLQLALHCSITYKGWRLSGHLIDLKCITSKCYDAKLLMRRLRTVQRWIINNLTSTASHRGDTAHDKLLVVSAK